MDTHTNVESFVKTNIIKSLSSYSCYFSLISTMPVKLTLNTTELCPRLWQTLSIQVCCLPPIPPHTKASSSCSDYSSTNSIFSVVSHHILSIFFICNSTLEARESSLSHGNFLPNKSKINAFCRAGEDAEERGHTSSKNSQWNLIFLCSRLAVFPKAGIKDRFL